MARTLFHNVRNFDLNIVLRDGFGSVPENGMVKVVMTCKHEMRRVSIDPSVMSDREMLEDLLVAALNDAAHKADATVQEKMGSLTAGMGLPAGLKLPF